MARSNRYREALDREIATIYQRRCAGIQIGVLDIGEIYKAARTAAAAGDDMEAAIVATAERLRKN